MVLRHLVLSYNRTHTLCVFCNPNRLNLYERASRAIFLNALLLLLCSREK